MKVIKLESKGWVNLPKSVTTTKIISTIKSAAKAAAKLIEVSPNLNIVVKPNMRHVIDVTGTGAMTLDAELVDITFDPKRAADKKFLKHIEASAYHELNHASRFYLGIKHKGYLDWWVLEGLATVFERDYADYQPPWGMYKASEMKKWIPEIKQLGDNFKWDHYMFYHPDGRRWIGYKTGTYIVDQAIKKSGKNVIELTRIKPEEIIKLSEF